MTVIKLSNGDLWVHSPVRATDKVLSEINSFGVPRYIVSPNKLHHLHLNQWHKIFPNATLYAPPGLSNKRPDINFSANFPIEPDSPWKQEIGDVVFEGSPVMEEVVFFHYATKTLILGDLIENFPQGHFSGFRKLAARAAGILSPNGKTPLDWRITFVVGKKAARESFSRMISWKPENIIVAHGKCIKGQGTEVLRKSFSWLG